MDFFKRAHELGDEMIANRRTLHAWPEVGFELPKTREFVKAKLAEMGYTDVREVGGGIVADVGKPGKTFLLRSDMDALPLKEDTGLPYASQNEYCHACGHDTHTAWLLGTAKMLKEAEHELHGTVRLMFQPAEEILTGAMSMIEAGVLKNPDVDAAMTMHISSAQPLGIGVLKGPRTAACNNFRIIVTGKGTHGADPDEGVDPVLIGAHIIIALQELVTREINFTKGAVITTGHFKGGSVFNIIPPNAMIEGTMRTFTISTQEHLRKRIVEVAKAVAETFRGTAEVEYLCDVPVLYNNEELMDELSGYINELADGRFDVFNATASSGSEDFACVAGEVPGVMLTVGAQVQGEEVFPGHNPKVKFDENALPMAAAVFAHCAASWLEKHA